MDVYKVGVELALTGTIAAALSKISGQLLGMDGQVKGLEKSFLKWNDTAKGALALGLGVALDTIALKLTKSGGEIQRQVGLLQNLGNSTNAALGVLNSAQADSTKAAGTTIAGNMAYARELSTILPNLGDAQKALALILPDAVATARATGVPLDDLIRIGTKATELRGDATDPVSHALDPTRFVKGFRAMEAAIQVANGNLGPADFYNAMKQAGPLARMETDPEKFWAEMLGPMMDTGGSRAGTAYMSMGRQLIGGRMSFAAAEHMAKMGLLDGSKIHKAGGAVSIDDGAWAGQDMLEQGKLLDWMQMAYLPALAKSGITKPNDVIKEIMKDFSAQTGVRLATLFAMNDKQIERDKGLVHKTMGQDWYGNMMANDLGANVSGVSSAITNFMGILGGPLVQPAIAGLQGLTSGINSLTTGLTGNKATPYLSGGVAVAGAGLTGVGLWKLGKSAWDMMSGGGLTGSAVALNGSAAALTEAAVALGAKGVTGGVGPGAKAGGLLGFLGGPIGVGATLAAALATFDPKGNFWGLTSGIDNAAKKYLGFNPSDVHLTPNTSTTSHPIPMARGAGSNTVSIDQKNQAQVTVNIDGKTLAKYVTDMVMQSVSKLVAHPTAAPMAPSMSVAPAVDGYTGGMY